MLVLAGMTAEVSEEVHGAALPGRSEDLGQRGLQTRVRVADGQLDADQAPRDQGPQELGPERLGLGLADVEADDLAATGLVDGMGDDHSLALHAAAPTFSIFASTNTYGSGPPAGVPERLNLLVEQPGDPRHLAL